MLLQRNNTSRARSWTACVLLVIMVLVFTELTTAATPYSRQSTRNQQHRHRILRKGAWVGAGFAAGRVVGPAGSAAVGTTKYRKDLKAGGRRRTRAIAKIGGPIAAGVVAGPAGSAGYAAVEHRHWIKRHIFRGKRHG